MFKIKPTKAGAEEALAAALFNTDTPSLYLMEGPRPKTCFKISAANRSCDPKLTKKNTEKQPELTVSATF